MKVEIGKVETVNWEVTEIIDKEEVKRKMPFVKLSAYVPVEDFPDAIAYKGATMTLVKPEDTLEVVQDSEYRISAPLREAISKGLKAIADSLDLGVEFKDNNDTNSQG